MARICEGCGETFETLTQLRLHECPEGEREELLEAFVGRPDTEALPDRPLTREEFENLQADERINQVEEVLTIPGSDKKVISFVYETEELVFGMHSDHDTGEWIVTTRGTPDEFEDVEARHDDWVSSDIEQVTGGPVNMDNIGPLPDDISVDCTHCDGAHTLSAEPSRMLAEMGFMEYEGYCAETGRPLIQTRTFDELAE